MRKPKKKLKLKTKRAAAKRFKVTAKKKVLHSKANKSHILTKKPTKRTRNLRKAALVFSGEAKVMKKLIPYK